MTKILQFIRQLRGILRISFDEAINKKLGVMDATAMTLMQRS